MMGKGRSVSSPAIAKPASHPGCLNAVVARSSCDEAIQNPTALTVWIVSLRSR